MQNNILTISIFGDIVGKIGQQGLTKYLQKEKSDLIIANVENLTNGHGIHKQGLQELLNAGVDIFTSGHHVFDNLSSSRVLNDPTFKNKLIRPANIDPKLPGQYTLTSYIKNWEITILNLQGRLFMKQEASSPLLTFDVFWEKYKKTKKQNSLLIVDFHAETTSEKYALSYYIDGRADILFGTHTHVPTNDLKICEKGEVYITDVGMVGAYNSVLGFKKESSIKRFSDQSTAIGWEIPKNGSVEVNSIKISWNLTKNQAQNIEQIRQIIDI